ncbi:MAG: hypothetical protein KAR42_02655 [candidate division Zixibacteria bacterium]|nr:hypothetical protein [candidate division Zixibacteria bacterium]
MSLISNMIHPSFTDDLTLSRNIILHNSVRQWVRCAGLCLLLSLIMLFALTAVTIVHLSPKPQVPSTKVEEEPAVQRFVQTFENAFDNKEVI